MGEERFLIVNADDLGLSDGVNAGIAAAHERGIVTSASLMARQSAAADGARCARRHPTLAVGLHIDIGQWDYGRGEWTAAYERCPPGDEAAVEAECRAQLKAFRELLGRDPTHLDSHQHVHMSEPVASVAARMASELGVPLRATGRVRYEGGFYGQSGRGEAYPEGISAEHLVELIGSLPAGWTELGCHPGCRAAELSSYGVEREREVEALCDPRVAAAIEAGGVELRSFARLN
ncbi:MAG TPA: ChbG/HpnK family deacetylase [Solirubrobacterales bacterium]|nr:ChbG/HpnK family deacetylase [Solirubrobacterales bacterium]